MRAAGRHEGAAIRRQGGLRSRDGTLMKTGQSMDQGVEAPFGPLREGPGGSKGCSRGL